MFHLFHQASHRAVGDGVQVPLRCEAGGKLCAKKGLELVGSENDGSARRGSQRNRWVRSVVANLIGVIFIFCFLLKKAI